MEIAPLNHLDIQNGESGERGVDRLEEILKTSQTSESSRGGRIIGGEEERQNNLTSVTTTPW